MSGDDFLLDLLIGNDPSLRGIDQKHPARLQAPLPDDALGRNGQHAGLRRHDHQIVPGDVKTRRTQAVAVENGADAHTVCKGDTGRSVPGLHQTGMVLVESLFLLAHLPMSAPGLGDHHHHRVGEGAAGEVKKLQAVVEHGRVAAAFIDDRQDPGPVVPQFAAGQQGLTGMHPVDVAPQGIYLSVVGGHAVGMGAHPVGKGVGGKARVDQGQGALDLGVAQVEKIVGELAGGEHSLVDDDLAGKAADVERLLRKRPHGLDPVGQVTPADVETAFEGELVGEFLRAADKDLPDDRLQISRTLPETAVVGRNRPPAEKTYSVIGDDLLGQPFAAASLLPDTRQIQHADGILAGLGEGGKILGAFVPEELMGNLQQDSGAVATIRVAADRSAMLDIGQNIQSLAHQKMTALPFDVGHEADPAGFVLIPVVVKPLLAGRESAEGHDGLNLRWIDAIRGKKFSKYIPQDRSGNWCRRLLFFPSPLSFSSMPEKSEAPHPSLLAVFFL